MNIRGQQGIKQTKSDRFALKKDWAAQSEAFTRFESSHLKFLA